MKGRLLVIASMILAALLVLASVVGISAFFVIRYMGSGVVVEDPGIEIHGSTVILKADLNVPMGRRIGSHDLHLVSGSGRFPVEIINNSKASVEMSGPDLTSMIEDGSVDIEGKVELEGGLPIPKVGANVKRSIDLSFIDDLNKTLKVENITLGFSGIGQIRIGMEIQMDREPGIWVKARNTSADIGTAFASFKGFIEQLDLHLNGTGRATVLIPTLAILPLTFGRNQVTVGFHGIEFVFSFPID
ncbi:MAG: hypothetical protein QCI82_02405 [Candidatus Thermoplasmatota archaeon]|nr:hypothetical protein [Candidatus Thermoplasmatota archaeon]